jgi:hypothetical protein
MTLTGTRDSSSQANSTIAGKKERVGRASIESL